MSSSSSAIQAPRGPVNPVIVEQETAEARIRSLLVRGGGGPGKSAYAQGLAEAHGPDRVYLAAAAAGDEEMAARIARHQADRGQGWATLEEPTEIATALAAHAQPSRVV